MTAYATADLFAALTAHLDLEVQEDVDTLLTRATDDIDSYLAWPAPVAAGRRIDVSALTAYQADVLAQACVRQAAYRLVVDELDMAEGAPRVLATGGPITFAPTAPDRIGPDVLVLLAGAGLLKRTGCAAPPPDPDPEGCPWAA